MSAEELEIQELQSAFQKASNDLDVSREDLKSAISNKDSDYHHRQVYWLAGVEQRFQELESFIERGFPIRALIFTQWERIPAQIPEGENVGEGQIHKIH